MNTLNKQTSFIDASKRTAAFGASNFKTLLTLFILFLSVGVWGQPFIRTSGGYGQYGYIEKDAAVTNFLVENGGYGNIYQYGVRTYLAGPNINKYNYTGFGSCARGDDNTSNYDNSSNALEAGNIMYSSVFVEYCGPVYSCGSMMPTAACFNERSFFVMDVVGRTDALVSTVNYGTGTNVVLSFTISNNNTSGQALNRLWIQNDGTAAEGSDIVATNGAFRVYYEAATGSETFNGNESFGELYGNYGGNVTNNNIYGNDALGISIPQNTTGGLRCYVVLMGSSTYLTASAIGKTVRLNVTADGMSITPNRNTSFSLMKMDLLRPSDSYIPIAATNFYSKSSGNLELTSSWGTNTDGSGSEPLNFTSGSSTFNIRNNATPTIGASWTVSGAGSKIIVGDGTNACNFSVPSTFIVTSPTTDVSNNGTLTRTSSGVQSFGTLNVLAGGTYDHNYATGSLPTATWNSTSTLLVSADLQSNNFAGVTFGNVTFRNAAGTTMFTSISANQSATIAGNLNLQGTGAINMSNQAAFNSTLTVNGNVNISGNSTFRIENQGAASGTNTKKLLVLGNYDQSNGTMDLATNTSTTMTNRQCILEVRGNFTHTGGTLTENASGASTVMITRILLSGTTGSQTLESTGQTNSVNFNVAGSNAQCVVAATKTFTLSSTSTMTIGAGTSAPDLSVSGTFLNQSSTALTVASAQWAIYNGANYIHNTTGAISTPIANATFNSGSTMTYRGSSTLQPSISFSGRTYHHLVIESTSGALSLSGTGGSSLIINGDLTIGANCTLGPNVTGTPGHSIKGNISIGSGGTLNYNPASAGTINLNGSGTQTISGAGTFTTGSNATLAVGASSTIDFGATNAIAGSGTFTTASGSTLITANTSGINGSLTLTNKSLNAGTNYTFTGSTAQTTGTNLPATVNNFTISNTAGVTLPQSLTLNGSMSISGTGTTFTINPNAILTIAGTADFGGKSVTLKSDSSGTAAIGQVTGTLTNATNVTVERYIPAKRAWRALTAPLKGSNTSLYASWQNGGTAVDPFNTGVELWGPSGTGLATGPGYNIRQYTTSGWADVTNSQSTNLFTSSANNAYMVFVTGGYGSNNIGNGLSAATTLKATGQLITGTVSFPITSTRHTLVGNPFASPLSPSAILAGNTQANLYTNIWMWDPAISTNGAYVNYDASINSGTFSDVSGSYSSSTTAIQSGQAFFVRAVANTDTLTLTESMKSSSVSNTFRNSNSISASVFRIGFAKQIGTDWMPLDGAIAAFYDSANASVDPTDGTKMVNSSENIALVRGTTNLSIEHYPLVNATDQLNVKIWNTQQAHYKLKLNTEEFTMVGVEAYLQDLYTGTTQPLNLDGSVQDYEFDVDPTVSASSGNRFRIVFTNTALAVTNPEQGQLSIYPNPATGGKVTVSLPTGNFEGCSYELINVLGQVVRQDEIVNANSSQVTIPLTGLPNSWYALRIRKDNKVVYQGKLIINN